MIRTRRSTGGKRARGTFKRKRSYSRKRSTSRRARPVRRRRVASSRKKGYSPAVALGGAAGGLLGGYFGGPLGSSLGAMAGRFAGRAFRKVTGQGTYTVAQNSLMNRGTLPLSFGENTVVFKHSEMVSNIRSSVGFAKAAFSINPGEKSLFPWLSSIANNFEQWTPLGVVFSFKSTSSDALTGTNTAQGRVIMATEYNVLNSTAFPNANAMYNHEFSTSCKPASNMEHGIECKPTTMPTDVLYTRNNFNAATMGDKRLYDLGLFTIATEGMQAAGNIVGQLWVTYHIQFLKKQIPIDNDIAYTDTYYLPASQPAEAIANGSATTVNFGSQTRFMGLEPIPSPANNCDTIFVPDPSATSMRLLFGPSADPTNYLIVHRGALMNSAGIVGPTVIADINALIPAGSTVVSFINWSNQSSSLSVGRDNRFMNPGTSNTIAGAGQVTSYGPKFSNCGFVMMIRVEAFAGDSAAERTAAKAYIDLQYVSSANVTFWGAGNTFLVTTISDSLTTPIQLNSIAYDAAGVTEVPPAEESLFSAPVEETKMFAAAPLAMLSRGLPSISSSSKDDMPGHFGLSDEDYSDDDHSGAHIELSDDDIQPTLRVDTSTPPLEESKEELKLPSIPLKLTRANAFIAPRPQAVSLPKIVRKK